MCTNCNQTPCSQVQQVNSCDGCYETINADCIIYNDDRLNYESSSIVNNTSRTLSSILEALENLQFKRESKIIEFTTDGVSTYTLVPEDLNKILLLTQVDDGVVGTITNNIILPETEDFINAEIIFKNIATPLDTDSTTIVFQFNKQINTAYAPAATTNAYASLDDNFGVVRLRFVKTTPTSYQWIVC